MTRKENQNRIKTLTCIYENIVRHHSATIEDSDNPEKWNQVNNLAEYAWKNLQYCYEIERLFSIRLPRAAFKFFKELAKTTRKSKAA